MNLFSQKTSRQFVSVVLENKRNIKMLTRVGGVFFAVLSFFYLVVLNDVSTAGFDLQAARVEATANGRILEKLEAELSTPASIYALEHSVQVQEMIEVESRRYKVLPVATDVAYIRVY